MLEQEKSPSTSNIFWDLFCIFSMVGIWPRFIETRWISTTKLNFPIAGLPAPLKGLKIVQISDLHFHSKISDRFLNQLTQKVNALDADIIVFTGDFLCHSLLTDTKRLKELLNSFHARHGYYAVLGNHDYAKPVSINSNGDYDVVRSKSSSLKRAFSRLKASTVLTKQVTKEAKETSLHRDLICLLEQTPFRLLHNQTEVLKIGGAKLNICGLGEYMLACTQPEEAFKNYDSRYPGFILLHNPDGSPLLINYPGNLILSGHTHGGQVNLPWFWKKFTLLENQSLKKGLISLGNQKIYINRGLGGLLPFRWFSSPEILCLTLMNS